MSSDYASNCPISWPIPARGALPSADLGGVMWSPRWGLIYDSPEQDLPLRKPVG